jgi:hypothetical protein
MTWCNSNLLTIIFCRVVKKYCYSSQNLVSPCNFWFQIVVATAFSASVAAAVCDNILSATSISSGVVTCQANGGANFVTETI